MNMNMSMKMMVIKETVRREHTKQIKELERRKRRKEKRALLMKIYKMKLQEGKTKKVSMINIKTTKR